MLSIARLSIYKVRQNTKIDLKLSVFFSHIYLIKIYRICIPILYHEKCKWTLWKVFHNKK